MRKDSLFLFHTTEGFRPFFSAYTGFLAPLFSLSCVSKVTSVGMNTQWRMPMACIPLYTGEETPLQVRFIGECPFYISCCSSLFTCKSFLLGAPEPSCYCVWPNQYLGCFGCFSYRVMPVSLSLHQEFLSVNSSQVLLLDSYLQETCHPQMLHGPNQKYRW